MAESKEVDKVQSWKWFLLTPLVVALIALYTPLISYVGIAIQTIDPSACPLAAPIVPSDTSVAWKMIHGPEYRIKSAGRLSESVRIDTQVFDKPPSVESNPEYWVKFKAFHEFLEREFPLVYETLDLDLVNTYGIVLTWKGSNSKLKPLMLTAHQDTVPIQSDTLDAWTHPPLAGHYDGTFVYGRGSSDCKNVLIAIMESFEALIINGFKPQRSLLAVFGFDEEVSGYQGAKFINEFLVEKYGQNSLYAIIDEGPGVYYTPFSKLIVATVANGEKGYLDLTVKLGAQGGHSSVPPDHTTIGIISELTFEIENDPYPSILTSSNPLYRYMQCFAVHATGLSSIIRKTILRSSFNKVANSKLVEYLERIPISKYLIKTSQSCDVIRGGEKANALPEYSELLVNHRISVDSSVEQVKQHFSDRVLKIAKKHNITLESYGEIVYQGSTHSKFIVETFGEALEPAPVSPFNDTVWDYLVGTTRHVFEDLVIKNLTEPIIVAPAIMPANTDTKHYWDLTSHIFRFSPMFIDMLGENNIHSVDEKIRLNGHLELTAFFYQYIQNVDSEAADNRLG
ncbi:Gly-Xaa carboxypeptidase [Scheffersomyces spartinae]|uniref:Gly-Xaa carboxypeptidase n=1 Tax=Scheffersomyces spartinae TaxID=45513 RepID=A0A9P8AJ23_9ASCO|nr:Gly-Xaa carboxypeptidase [Scheffersomyces spartinae]KAG7195013.1 Gly-Xaa carboxypeptidase [Scheffersomyces spartinae]